MRGRYSSGLHALCSFIYDMSVVLAEVSILQSVHQNPLHHEDRDAEYSVDCPKRKRKQGRKSKYSETVNLHPCVRVRGSRDRIVPNAR